MANNCIFCGSIITKISKEHVFPATIGGGFIITSICVSCNENLGKTIDLPFSKHAMIAWYRNVMQIKRNGPTGNRSIHNPVKGTHTSKNGDQYYVNFKDGIPQAIVVRKYIPPTEVNGETIGKMTIPAKDFISEEQMRLEYSKKFDIDPSLIQMKSKESSSGEPIEIVISSQNSVFILEALKIACEFTVTVIPSYNEDMLFKTFVNILLTKDYSRHLDLFDINPSAGKIISNLINANKQTSLHWHFAMLITIPGNGLYCVIKIFDWIYPFRISVKDSYLKINTSILLINDALQQSWMITLPTHLTSSFNIIFNENSLSGDQVNYLQISSKDNFIEFKNENGNLPVYDCNGKLMFVNLLDLSKQIEADVSCYNEEIGEIKINKKYKLGDYFIRSKERDFLFPIEEVEYIYKLK